MSKIQYKGIDPVPPHVKKGTCLPGQTAAETDCVPEGGGGAAPKLPSDQLHLLRQLQNGSLSVDRLHRLQPGLASARGMYITTVLPMQELERAGLVEKAGQVEGQMGGVGAGYAGPGSAPADRVEQGDPARIIYKLTDRGRSALGLPKEESPEEDTGTFDRNVDFKSRMEHIRAMVSAAQRELERSKGKPRLEAAARRKLAEQDKQRNKLRAMYPDLAAKYKL